MFPLHFQDPRFHIFHQDYLPSWFIQESIRDIDHSEASSFSLYLLIFPYVSCLFCSLSNLSPPANFLWLLDPYLCLLFFWMKTRLVALKMECCKTIKTQKKKERKQNWMIVSFISEDQLSQDSFLSGLSISNCHYVFRNQPW